MTKIACKPARAAGLVRREILVVIAVLLLAVLLILPYLNQRRIEVRRTLCEARQMRTAQAILRHALHRGHLPGYRNLQAIDARGQRRPASWVFPVLPYLFPLSARVDQPPSNNPDDVLQWLEKNKGLTGPYAQVYEDFGEQGPEASRGGRPKVYVLELVCPANPPEDAASQPGWNSFVVNTGMSDAQASSEFPADWPSNGVFTDQFSETGLLADPTTLEFIAAHDGLNDTILLSENVDSGLWTDESESKVGFVWVAGFVNGQPDPGDKLRRINDQIGHGDGSIRFARPSSYHPGGVNAAMCNGSTRFLDERIDYVVYVQLMTTDRHNVRYPGTDKPVEAPYRLERPK